MGNSYIKFAYKSSKQTRYFVLKERFSLFQSQKNFLNFINFVLVLFFSHLGTKRARHHQRHDVDVRGGGCGHGVRDDGGGEGGEPDKLRQARVIGWRGLDFRWKVVHFHSFREWKSYEKPKIKVSVSLHLYHFHWGLHLV